MIFKLLKREMAFPSLSSCAQELDMAIQSWWDTNLNRMCWNMYLLHKLYRSEVCWNMCLFHKLYGSEVCWNICLFIKLNGIKIKQVNLEESWPTQKSNRQSEQSLQVECTLHWDNTHYEKTKWMLEYQSTQCLFEVYKTFHIFPTIDMLVHEGNPITEYHLKAEIWIILSYQC